VLVDLQIKCPCESGRVAADCCFVTSPPLVQAGGRIQQADLQAAFVTEEGIGLALPSRFQFQIELKQPYQLDPDVEAIHRSLFKLLPVPPGGDTLERLAYLTKRGQPIASFAHSLYGTRYHQRQFLFRLGRVFAEEQFAYAPSRGNVEIVIHDRPLQAEFEAFLLRVMSSLDALCALLCALLDKERRKYSSFRKLLEVDESLPVRTRDKLRSGFNKAGAWLDQLRALRNAVAHEGGVAEFKGVAHAGVLVRDAEVGGLLAGAFVIRTWRELRELAWACEACLRLKA